jgi:hypothetical protein
MLTTQDTRQRVKGFFHPSNEWEDSEERLGRERSRLAVDDLLVGEEAPDI